MLSKKPLILTLAMAFSVHSPNGHAQEKSKPLLFALAVGKALINKQSDDQQREIVETAKQRGSLMTSLMISRFRSDKRPEEPENIEEESEAIEWWELKLGVEAEAYCRAASDEGSGSEDGPPDNNNRSNEDEADADASVHYVNTTLNPFRVSNEISQHCAALELKKIKQEPDSDSERTTESEVDETETGSVNHLESTSPAYSSGCTTRLKRHKQTHLPVGQKLMRLKKPKVQQCDHEGCSYRTNQTRNLKRHKQIHLPANQRAKLRCDHEDCNYSTYHSSNLKKHKQTHLPADQRPKPHQCGHKGCNYSTGHTSHLKTHKQSHLSADQRPKPHHCGHKGCNYSTNQTRNLKKHRQTHLPVGQRPKKLKVHQCEHEGCNYSSNEISNLKRHKETHLPANQRARLQCDHEGCNYITNLAGNLKRHKQTHLPAGQDEAESGVQYVNTTLNPFRVANEISQYCATLELKKIKQEAVSDTEIATESEVETHLPTDQRLKRKAHDQLPSNEKRKKVDQE